MSLIIPNGYGNAKILFHCSGSSKEISFALGYFVDDRVAPTIDDRATAILEAFTNTGGPFAEDVMSDQWQCLGVQVHEMAAGVESYGEDMSAVPGVVDDPPPPMNCSILVQKRTGLVGRKHLGRMYSPPCTLDEAHVNAAGDIDTVQHTAIQGFWEHARTEMELVFLFAYLLHASAGAPTPITQFRVETKIATQRRRLR